MSVAGPPIHVVNDNGRSHQQSKAAAQGRWNSVRDGEFGREQRILEARLWLGDRDHALSVDDSGVLALLETRGPGLELIRPGTLRGVTDILAPWHRARKFQSHPRRRYWWDLH